METLDGCIDSIIRKSIIIRIQRSLISKLLKAQEVMHKAGMNGKSNYVIVGNDWKQKLITCENFKD